VRNPCFGLDEDITAAKGALESVSSSYASFKNRFRSRVVGSQEALDVFEELKSTLLNQFPRKDVQSDCPDIQTAWDDYNQYVDSIGQMKCVVKVSEDVLGGTFSAEGLTILMSRARQLDKLVSRWLVSIDPMERHDLDAKCQNLIDEVNGLIGKSNGRTAEERQAIATFRAAERYFYRTCRQ
jgi:hypothetical protein